MYRHSARSQIIYGAATHGYVFLATHDRFFLADGHGLSVLVAGHVNFETYRAHVTLKMFINRQMNFSTSG